MGRSDKEEYRSREQPRAARGVRLPGARHLACHGRWARSPDTSDEIRCRKGGCRSRARARTHRSSIPPKKHARWWRMGDGVADALRVWRMVQGWPDDTALVFQDGEGGLNVDHMSSKVQKHIGCAPAPVTPRTSSSATEKRRAPWRSSSLAMWQRSLTRSRSSMRSIARFPSRPRTT